MGPLSLVYSHRIAGTLYRIRRCVDMLAEGKNRCPIPLGKHDESKKLAASLDKLRAALKEKGFLS